MFFPFGSEHVSGQRSSVEERQKKRWWLFGLYALVGSLGSELWILCSGLWDLGSGLWALDSGLCALRRNVSSAGGALPCFRLRRFPRAARNPVATQPMALTYTYDLSAELRDVCSFSIDTT